MFKICCNEELIFPPTSFGASFSMKSVYIFLALEDSFWGDLVFLKSSQASQNSIFSSQNSDFKKALNAARPSGERGGGKSIQNVNWVTN